MNSGNITEFLLTSSGVTWARIYNPAKIMEVIYMREVKNPRFSQRHYEALAQVLRAEHQKAEGLEINRAHLWSTIEALIRMFEEDNPKFKRHMFRKAILGGAV